MSSGAGEHTPEPWFHAYDDGNGQAVISGQHTEICTCWHHSVVSLEKQMFANAERIVACVNALAGIPTPELSTLLGEVRGVLVAALESETALVHLGNVPDTQLAHGLRTLLAKLPVQS